MHKTIAKLLILASTTVLALTVAHAAEKPAAYKDFTRLTWEQMQDIASDTKLSHRIFYKPSSGPNAAWFDAVKKGDLPAIKKMVEAGQNIEVVDSASLNQTALGWAAFIGYLDVVEYLVGKGANLFATDKADVQHAFKSAVLGGNMPVIRFLYPLMQNKIDLNAKDVNDEETAIMVAAWNNRVEAVSFLLAHSANPNIVAMKPGNMAYDHDALTYACQQGNKEVAAILVKAGAINHKTGKGSCQ